MSITIKVNVMGTPVETTEYGFSTSLGAITHQAVRRVLAEEGKNIVSTAKEILRDRIIHPEKSTGRLGRSIMYRRTNRGINVYAGAPYGLWVEGGTRKFIGHHMIRDAVKAHELIIRMKIKYEVERQFKEKEWMKL